MPKITHRSSRGNEAHFNSERETRNAEKLVRASSPRLLRFFKPSIILALLLAAFCFLQWTLPLATAIKVGADEDFALSKAMLSLKGYKMYSDFWNDQPPLHTFLLKSLFQHVSHSVLAARLLTIASTLLLLSAFFVLAFRINGLLPATLATILLIASPGFLELSASAMVEISGLAPAMAALCLLYTDPLRKWRLTEVAAGLVFAFALQIKLLEALYLPLAALILWLRCRKMPSPFKHYAWRCVCFGIAIIAGFVVINYATGNTLASQFEQSRSSHFSSTRSHEYGSPADHPFEWNILLKNWDTVLPALIGIGFLIRQLRHKIEILLPLSWLILTVAIFATFKPWWSYYYIHTAIPFCWCAAVGIGCFWQIARTRKRVAFYGVAAIYAVCALPWMTARLYLQAKDIRNSPQIYSSPVLTEIQRYKPFTKFIFANEPVFAFHTDIAIPPNLATLSLKRFWTGHMTNAKLAEGMQQIKPGIILLPNNTREVPFQELLYQEYRLVYQDSLHRLYVLSSIIAQAEP